MRKVLFILGELDDEDLGWLIETGCTRQVPPGTSIIMQGAALDHLFIVLEGEFSVSVGNGVQREVARLGPGEVVGDMSLLDSRPPNATVTAVDAGSVFAIPQATLRHRLAAEDPFAARFYRALCIFLANRLSRAVAMVDGGGAPSLDESVQAEDELSPDVLEKVSLAGARFNVFLQQVKESGG